MPVLLETEDVLFAQGINMGQACVVVNVAACQNVNGENLDGVFGLNHKVSVQRYSHSHSSPQEWRESVGPIFGVE